MLHDYWMYRPDLVAGESWIAWGRARCSIGSREYEQPDGLLRKLPWWSFVDWVSSGELPTVR